MKNLRWLFTLGLVFTSVSWADEICSQAGCDGDGLIQPRPIETEAEKRKKLRAYRLELEAGTLAAAGFGKELAQSWAVLGGRAEVKVAESVPGWELIGEAGIEARAAAGAIPYLQVKATAAASAFPGLLGVWVAIEANQFDRLANMRVQVADSILTILYKGDLASGSNSTHDYVLVRLGVGGEWGKWNGKPGNQLEAKGIKMPEEYAGIMAFASFIVNFDRSSHTRQGTFKLESTAVFASDAPDAVRVEASLNLPLDVFVDNGQEGIYLNSAYRGLFAKEDSESEYELGFGYYYSF